MKTLYHLEITTLALAPHFSAQALHTILDANTAQDKIRYQLGRHNHFHFDGSAFDEGFNYTSQQESLIPQHLAQGAFFLAQQALGRLTHTWQDFYSHSNYVQLWHKKFPGSQPKDINPTDLTIFSDPRLKSGKNNPVLECFNRIPWLSNLVNPLMPADSHARLNLDSPSAGMYFDFAYQAALCQTREVYDQLVLSLNQKGFTPNEIASFTGKQTGK